MFNKAHNFNNDLNDWDVSEGEDFSGMFAGAFEFNGSIKKWKVGSAKKLVSYSNPSTYPFTYHTFINGLYHD